MSWAKWVGIPTAVCVGTVCGAPLVIGAIGFSAAGPVAGSVAAGWMSSIAVANGVGVTTGSTYAAVQSLAMTGSLLSAKAGVGAAVVGAASGASAKAAATWKSRDAPASKL